MVLSQICTVAPFDVCVGGDRELLQIALCWISGMLRGVRAFPRHVLAEESKRQKREEET